MERLSKTDFFNLYGNLLVQVHEDDVETGDYQLFCPEESHIAKEYIDKGYNVASIFQSENEEDYVLIDDDPNNSLNKIGYLILEPIN
jgi:hypothetical protein